MGWGEAMLAGIGASRGLMLGLVADRSVAAQPSAPLPKGGVDADVSRNGNILVETVCGARGTERFRFGLKGATDEIRKEFIERVVEATVDAAGGVYDAATDPDAQLGVSGAVPPAPPREADTWHTFLD